MGDKTQLATIALATKFPHSPVGILIGTTSGMLIADGIGIIIGIVLQKKIPERAIKLVSAGAFMLFGLIGIYQSVRNDFGMSIGATIGILGGAAVAVTAIAAFILFRPKRGGDTEA
jgi:hypothetical protein